MRLGRTASRPILVAALLLALPLACGSPSTEPKPEQAPDRAELGRVSWSAVGPEAAGLGRDEIADLARKELARVAAPAAAIAQHRVDLTGTIDTTAGEGALMFEAVFAPARDGVPVSATLAATGQADSPDAARSLVRKGLGDLAAALDAMARLSRGGPEDWTRALVSAEPDEQRLAAVLLGRDRVRQAVPGLAEMLSDPREPVAESAAEALVAIGDRSAVPLLIKSIRRGDLRSEVRVIEALGRLGGPEAEAYLEMTAGGHEVEEVRRLSERALENLRTSKSAKSL